MLKIPFDKISSTGIYNNVDIAIDMPFDDYVETDDACCEMRFYIPPIMGEGEEGAKDFSMANLIHDTIIKKANIQENVSDLIVSLPDLPMVVPRGKYTADLYKNFLKLHGSTFNYTIQYKNVVKAFLLPQPDGIHMSFILGFDKPLRQGNTQYRFLIFQFKSEEHKTIDMMAAYKENLTDIHKDLQPQYEGNYYEIVAKLFKMIIGVNIIIPGEFKTTSGHSALRCNVGNQEGHLFPLNKSLIFIKKPVTYIRIDEIARAEFQRVDAGLTMRNFDFDIITKNGDSFVFNSIEKRELDKLMEYFQNKKILVETVREEHKMLDDDDFEEDDESEESNVEGKRRKPKPKAIDGDEDPLEDESEDDSFVQKEDGEEDESSEDGDYEDPEK